MDKIKINYKQFSFEVDVDQADETNFTLIGISPKDSVDEVEDYNESIFFDSFCGNNYPNGEYVAVTKKIKRSFGKYVREIGTEPATPQGGSEPTGSIDKIIFDTVSRALGSSGVKSEIDSHIKELIKEHGIVPHRTVLELKFKDYEKADTGLQHKDFQKILTTLSTGVNVCLVGPAGSGKTTIVANASKALKLEFASQSVSAQSTTFDFFGYKSATGDYISTLFREKYENGGVFLLDEFDAGNPNVLAALNQATANGHAPFPDKMVTKHEDFIIIMAGNTFGGGGTIDYVGRNKIDAATLDRFAFIYIDYDEQLERDLSTNSWWCERVQKFRAEAIRKKVRTIISPRATFHGEKLLHAGISQEEVEEMVIYKGLTADEKDLIRIY